MLFLAFLLYFVPVRLIQTMSDMTKKFQSICRVLVETDWNTRYTMTFADVCRRFKADPVAIDNLLYATMGMGGDEVIESYRNGPLIF